MTRKQSSCFALLLAAALMLPACGAASTSAPADTTAAESEAAQTSQVTETGRADVKDSLPDDLDFGGETFTVLARDDQFLGEFYVEEESGDVVEDAVYNRNAAVAERLNIDYEVFKGYAWSDYPKELTRIAANVAAGDDAYQAIAGYSIHIVKLTTDNIFVNLNTLKYLSLDQPWWSPSVRDEMQFAGQLYYATGDICLTFTNKIFAVFFDAQVAKNHNIAASDLYACVDDGTWTTDKFTSEMKGLYSDLNGDGAADDSDSYGLAITQYNSIDAVLPGFRQDVTTNGADGYPAMSLDCERTANIISWIYSLMYENTDTRVLKNKDGTENTDGMIDMFMQDRALFMLWSFDATDDLREMESDFGVLPYPKWDDNQDSYGAYMQDGHSLMCVPITASDLDMTGAALEALAAESYRTVSPAYFEVALKTKYSRDNDTIRMLELIRDDVKYNFGYVYMVDAFWCARTMMADKKSDFTTWYAKKGTSFEKTLAKFVKAMEENKT